MQQHLNFTGQQGCVICGKTQHEAVESFSRKFPATPVEWRCCSCDGLVCQDCCLKLPDDHPDKTATGCDQYYNETYCSERCRIVDEGTQQLKGIR